MAGVILAAGSSTRMGRPKQLLDLGGKPALQHVLDAAASAALEEIVLVLGHRADEIAAALRLPRATRAVVNGRYAEGQSTSLRAGLGAVSDGAGAAVILLGDQPGVRTEAIVAVAREWRTNGDHVVQASYRGRPAHPTLFDRSVWPELDSVSGDEGARSVVGAHPEWRTLVEVGGDPPDDLDTEEDYARLKVTFRRGGDRLTGGESRP